MKETTLTQAVTNRRTIRAFKPDPVDPDLIREVLELAARAPSNGNLQPWRVYVLSGESLQTLKEKATQTLEESGFETPDYEVYPNPLPEPYRTHRFQVGEALYKTIGVERENKAGRLAQFAKNAQLFGAPVGIFLYIDRRMGPGQWMDLGSYLQTLMLLLEERGLGSCAQGYWTFLAKTVASVTQPPEEWMLACGLAVGVPDEQHPINTLRASREPTDQFATFLS